MLRNNQSFHTESIFILHLKLITVVYCKLHFHKDPRVPFKIEHVILSIWKNVFYVFKFPDFSDFPFVVNRKVYIKF